MRNMRIIFVVLNERGRPVASGTTRELAIKSYEAKSGNNFIELPFSVVERLQDEDIQRNGASINE